MADPTVFWLNPFTVNAGNTKGQQTLSSPLGLADGSFLIAWTDDTNNVDSSAGTDIIAQHFDPLGNKIGSAFHLNHFGMLASETDVSMVALQDGGFAIAYEQNSNLGDTDILYEVYDAGFARIDEGAVALGAAGADQVRNPSLVYFSAADFLTATFERTSLGDTDIKAFPFDGFGEEYDAAQNSSDVDRNPDSAAWSTVDFITVYEEDDAGTTSIEYQIRTGSSVFVDQGTVASKGEDPHVAVLADDQTCVITWTAPGGGIIGEIRDRDGTLIRNNFAIANIRGDDERSSDVVALDDGGFFAVWYDAADDRIEGLRFDASGDAVGSALAIDDGAGLARPELSLLSDGRVLVSWEDGGDIRAAIVDARDAPILGDGLANVLTGRPGGGNIVGFAGDDTLFGAAGDDLLLGGAGSDAMDGGGGTDTLVYVNSLAGVNVSLLSGKGLGGEAQGDTIANCENVQATDLNDVLIGDAGVNGLFGLDGDDVLQGGSGADNLNGGDGAADVLSYESSGAAVTVNLGTGKASGGDGKGDVFTGFEDLKGSSFGDSLTGDDFDNTLAGLSGEDLLRGQDGADVLSGAGGADRLIGGKGIDQLIGGAGLDTFALMAQEANRDALLDFTHGNDLIEISAAAFGGGLAPGDLAASQFRVNLTGLAEDADDRFIYRSDTKELYYDSNGTANGGHRLVASFTEPVAPDAGDFIIV